MATLVVRKITFGARTGGSVPVVAGVDLSAVYDTPAAGGDKFHNDGRTTVRIKCTDGTLKQVTFAAVKASDQGLLENVSINVPATSGHVELGPFDAAEFNDNDGNVNISYSAVTGVTIAAFSMAEKGRG